MRSLLCFFLGGLVYGCNQDKHLAAIPYFLSIPSVEVGDGGIGVVNTHRITEVWAYADSVFIGAFPVPGTIPALDDDDLIHLELFAGIRDNGQAEDPIIYPFYSTVRRTLSVSDGSSELVPRFDYIRSVKTSLSEGFENGNIFREDLDGNDETRLEVVSHERLDGLVGAFALDPQHRDFEVASAFALNQLPTDGSPVYLEMDYVSDVNLAVGLRGSSANVEPISFYKIVLFPTGERNKVYINFGPDLQASQLSSYQVIFKATYDESLSFDTQFVYLDNIKLLHF